MLPSLGRSQRSLAELAPIRAAGVCHRSRAPQADLIVYEEAYPHRADLWVHKEDFAHRASGNGGHWYFTEHRHRADFALHFTPHRHRADLSVYFVEMSHRAGWQQKQKKRLLDP